MVSDGTSIIQGAAGTATTLLHGNAAGAPSYSAVSLTTDVTGILPVANGGTNSATQNWVDLTTVQTAAGAKTWSNLATFSAGITSTGGAVNLNASGANITNIGNGTNNLIQLGTIDINQTGAANTRIGNTTGTLTLEGGTAATGIQIGNGATAHGIQIGTGAAANAIAIGSTSGTSSITEKVGTGNYSLDGVAASTYTIAASTTTGTITIGGTAQTGTISLGTSTGAETVNIATGASGVKTVHIADGATANIITIGNGAAVNTVTVGSTNTTSITTVNSGTGGVIINNGLAGASATPTIAIGPGADNGGTPGSVSIVGSNLAGLITVTTAGNNPANGTVIFTVTFANSLSFSTECYVMLTPGNPDAAALATNKKPYVSLSTKTQFEISCSSSRLNSSTTYIWYYMVVGK